MRLVVMGELWFKGLGFSRNPFSIKPAAFSYELFGNGVDEVLSGIEDGKVVFVEAPLGYGKTTLLKGIIHRYGGKRRVVYAHAVPSEKLDVKGLLKGSSLANFLTGSLPKGMILVVDESQNLLPDSTSEIAEFYGSGNIRAVVFFGTKYVVGSFPEGLSRMMNGNLVRLSKPTPEQAVSLVRGRIGNLPLISDEYIISAYENAQGSPRRLLQACEDFCRAAAEGRPLQQPVASSPVAAGKARSSAASKKKPKARNQPKASANAAKGKNEPAKKALKQKPAMQPARQSIKHAASYKKPGTGGRRKQKAALPEESTPTQEGVYWGEFMGMQK